MRYTSYYIVTITFQRNTIGETIQDIHYIYKTIEKAQEAVHSFQKSYKSIIKTIKVTFKKCLYSSKPYPIANKVDYPFTELLPFDYFDCSKYRLTEDELKRNKVTLKQLRKTVNHLVLVPNSLSIEYETQEAFEKENYLRKPPTLLKGYYRQTSVYSVEEPDLVLKELVKIAKKPHILWWGLYASFEVKI